METTTPANGHAKTIHLTSLMLPPQPTIGLKYETVLQLVKEAVEIEMELKVVLEKLDAAMKEVGYDDMPSVLMALVRRSDPLPGTHKLSSRPTVVVQEHPAQTAGGVMKAKILGLLSDKKERKAGDIVRRLRLVPNSAYTALNLLVKEGRLVRTRYAHYRLKLR